MEHFYPNILLDSVCVVATVLVGLYNYFCMKKEKRGTGYVFFVIFILLFSLYYRPVGGDFWSYLDSYQAGANVQYTHWESFYYWLLGIIPDNFLLWRTLIWLPAGVLIALIYRKMGIRSSYATTFFLLFALVQYYYYLRNVLGLSVLCYAIVIYCSHQGFLKKSLNVLIFFALSLVSWYLHKSMPVYILIAILAIVLPFNKHYILGAIIAIPLLYGLVLLVASDFVEMSLLWNEGNGSFYLESKNTFDINWKGAFDLFIRYLPIVYFNVIAFRKPLPKDNPDFSYFKVFLLFSFFLLCLSFLFYGQGSIALQNRFYMSSMFPFAFIVGLYFKYNIKSRQFKIFTYLTLIMLAWKLFLLVVLGV